MWLDGCAADFIDSMPWRIISPITYTTWSDALAHPGDIP
jgi:hypothetical protein